jgi:cytoskeletal protein CcmA (bactofilin family)
MWPTALLAALALLLLVTAPLGARAAERRTGETAIVATGEVIADDLVITGDRVVIDGTVRGDVLAAAQTVEVNGTIEGDLIAAGAAVLISGRVADDVRVAGGVLRLASGAQIGDDLQAGGMSLELRPGSAVGGALMFGGGQGLMAGAVGEELLFAGEGLDLRGSVGRDVEAYVGGGGRVAWPAQVKLDGAPAAPQVPSGLTVAQSARVAGSLSYTSRESASLPPGAVAGRVTFSEQPSGAAAAPTPVERGTWAWVLDLARRYAALLLVGLLLLWLAPRLTREVTGELESQPLASLGWGFISIFAIALAFLLVPLATVILAVLLGTVKLTGLMGLVIAIGTLALLALAVLTIIAIAYVAQIAVSFELGRLILLRLRPAWTERPYAPLALGLSLLVLLTAIPGVGGLFTLAAVLLGLGALWLLGRDSVQHRPIPVPVKV